MPDKKINSSMMDMVPMVELLGAYVESDELQSDAGQSDKVCTYYVKLRKIRPVLWFPC
jgi:hypothetical protein